MSRRVVLVAALAGLAPTAALAQSSASDFTSAVRYDAMGRVVGTIAPDPDGSGPLHYAATRTTYDATGRPTSVEKGQLSTWQAETGPNAAPADWSGFTVFQTVTTTYDTMDRKLTQTLSSGGTAYGLTQYSYDSSGRLECTAVRMNPAVYTSLPTSACTPGTEGSQGPDRITRTVYDAAGQVTKVQKAYGTADQQDYAAYLYSDNGKQTRLTDANGNPASMTYDGFDREVQWNFPSATSLGSVSTTDYEAYTYDANGNRLSLRKRDGSVIGYTYDALNRVTVKTVPASASGAAGYSVYYGYDASGAQTYARFGSSSGAGITNTYDGFGRLAASSTNMDGTPRTLSSAYDADGNRTSLTGDAGAWYYTSGADYDGIDRATGLKEFGVTVVQFGYDSAGRRQSLTEGYGAGVTSSSSGYGYDGADRLSTLSLDFVGSASDLTTTLSYNPANQIVGRASSNDAYVSTTAYDVSRPYAVNGLNQYTSAGSASFAYDANGNLTSDGTNSYVYDAENRLVSRSDGTTLSYDPNGRLWQIGGSSGTTRFLYDGDRLVAESNSAGNVLRSYVHGPGADEPLIWYEVLGGFSRRFLRADQLGSIVAVGDLGGNAVAINAYDDWGIPNAGNVGRFGYTGQAWLPELGMWYYKARIYSPTLGRFLQTDPVGYKDQVNLYAYVGDDPLDARDSSGMHTCPAQDCKTVAGIIQNLAAIGDSMRMVTGSHIPSQASTTIAHLVSGLGKQGVDNGIRIENAQLTQGMLGQTIDGGRSSQTIQLDFGQISDRGGFPVGASVLGHEGVHAWQNMRLGSSWSYEEVYRREVQAYTVQGWILGARGWHIRTLPNALDRNFADEVHAAAKGDCYKQMIAYQDSHNRHDPFGGFCQ